MCWAGIAACLTQLIGAHEFNQSGKHNWLLGLTLQNQPISLSLKEASKALPLRAVSQGGVLLRHPSHSITMSLWA